MDKVNEEVRNANQAMVTTMRGCLNGEHSDVTDMELLNIMSDEQYTAYLTGWLMAKDCFDKDTDCTKETNMSNLSG